MAFEEILLPFFLFFTIATLYSSVGHAGASGYLAIMSLLSFGTESIKPISLILNIAVALIASVKFIRAGYFDRRIFLVFIVTSLPMAFLGGYLKVGLRATAADAWDSGALESGEEYVRAFDVLGEFNYYDTQNPGSVALIVVEPAAVFRGYLPAIVR